MPDADDAGVPPDVPPSEAVAAVERMLDGLDVTDEVRALARKTLAEELRRA